MKTIIIVLIIGVVEVFTGTIDRNDSSIKLNNECLAEYGINPESNGTRLTDEQAYCVAACIYRDYGIMRPDGTIDVDKTETFFTPDDPKEREIFFAVYDACKEGKVACKLVQCMFKELKSHWSSSSSSDANKQFFSSKILSRVL